MLDRFKAILGMINRGVAGDVRLHLLLIICTESSSWQGVAVRSHQCALIVHGMIVLIGDEEARPPSDFAFDYEKLFHKAGT